jgi:hypothetical protein
MDIIKVNLGGEFEKTVQSCSDCWTDLDADWYGNCTIGDCPKNHTSQFSTIGITKMVDEQTC